MVRFKFIMGPDVTHVTDVAEKDLKGSSQKILEKSEIVIEIKGDVYPQPVDVLRNTFLPLLRHHNKHGEELGSAATPADLAIFDQKHGGRHTYTSLLLPEIPGDTDVEFSVRILHLALLAIFSEALETKSLHELITRLIGNLIAVQRRVDGFVEVELKDESDDSDEEESLPALEHPEWTKPAQQPKQTEPNPKTGWTRRTLT